MLLGWVALTVGFALLFEDDDTVLLTGPIILTLAFLKIVMGLATRHWSAALFGLANIGACGCLLVASLIERWDPDDEEFIVLAGIYLGLATALLVLRLLIRFIAARTRKA
jgi:hypothetical protein